MGKPLISVVLPVFNGIETLPRALKSLRTQTFEHWELLAINDGSTDGSFELLRDWQVQDPRIVLDRTRVNQGPSSARNLAMEQARGETVAYLDCDDEFYPNYLAQVARLRDRADVLIFGYDYLTDGDNPSQARTWDPTPHRGLFFEGNLSTPLGVAHRRELWAKVGGFDESLWCLEDWEFWKRLARTGAEFLFTPLRSGLYRFRPGSRSQSPRVTLGQRAAFEANRAVGGSLYGASAHSARRYAVTKVLFAAPYSYVDPRNPASAAASDTMELLARSGFTCQAFSGVGMVDAYADDIQQTLDELGLPHQTRDSVCGSYLTRLTFTRKDNVPVTLVQPRTARPGYPRPEAVASFLTCFEKFLDTYQPDVLLACSVYPSLDPLIRLAKRRDITVVVPLLDAPSGDPMAFYHVDYCLVTSEEARRRYWEDLGLACITLPPPTDPDRAAPAYAEFFRHVHPQPGPPFVPK